MCCIVLGIVSDSGGQPTGTTEFITASFIKDTASPSKKIWTSWPAAANAFAWRNAKAAFVGSSEPHALLIKIFIRVSRYCCTPASRSAVADLSVSHRPLLDILLLDRNRPQRRPVCKRGQFRLGTSSLPPPGDQSVPAMNAQSCAWAPSSGTMISGRAWHVTGLGDMGQSRRLNDVRDRSAPPSIAAAMLQRRE